MDDSLALVTNSIARPPTNSSALRSAIEMLVPTTAWISVVSVVRRDSTSPVCVVSKNSGLCVDHVAVDGAADVGGDALAQPGHHVKARGGGQRQHGGHAEQRQEGACRRWPRWPRRLPAPKPRSIICLNAYGNRQRGAGGDDQRNAGQHELAAVRAQEGQQALQGGEAAFAVRVLAAWLLVMSVRHRLFIGMFSSKFHGRT